MSNNNPNNPTMLDLFAGIPLEDFQSPSKRSDSKQSDSQKSNHTPAQFSESIGQTSQTTEQSKPSQANLLPEESMSSREEYRASLGPLPGSDEARQMTATSGRQCFALSELSGPLGSVVKTCLDSLEWSSPMFSLIWKKQVISQRHSLFQLVPLEHSMNETGFGFWPTPTVHGNYNRMYPTLTASDGMRQAFTVQSLIKAVKRNQSQGHGLSPNSLSLSHQLANRLKLYLHPKHAERLMGYPMGHTELDASAMQLFLKSQQSLPKRSTKKSKNTKH